MSRLIYADEAKKNACKWECGGDPSCPYSKSNGITHEQCEFMRAIDECRTIDAVPVVHGHWVVIENDQNTDDRYKMQCSVCGETLWSIEPEELYCCKCGAKMDVLDTNVGNKEKVTE